MRFWSQSQSKVGKAPGYIPEEHNKPAKRASFKLIQYSKDTVTATFCDSASQISQKVNCGHINWVQVDGVDDIQALKEMSECFNIHPLIIEDIANTTHTPKVNAMDDTLFFILKGFVFDTDTLNLQINHVCILFQKKNNVLITFSDNRLSVFDMIEERIQKEQSLIRTKDVDFILLALFDAVVDQQMAAVENITMTLNDIEDSVISSPSETILKTILDMKRSLLFLKNSMVPLKDFLEFPEKYSSDYFRKHKSIYLKDVCEHLGYVRQISDHTLSMMDTLMDLFYSSTSYKMNEVIKVLTIISTIFIPLSFIVGLYGMNFNNMPELQWKYGYFTVLGIIALVVLAMVLFFKKKKWL